MKVYKKVLFIFGHQKHTSNTIHEIGTDFALDPHAESNRISTMSNQTVIIWHYLHWSLKLPINFFEHHKLIPRHQMTVHKILNPNTTVAGDNA